MMSFGEADSASLERGELSSRTLLLHREDHTVHGFDLFHPSFNGYNTLITGKAGSGKSVFGNLLSSSLLHDPDIILTKVDVGGSYKKESEIYGGNTVNFSLDRASGINPFRIFQDLADSNEAISTLTEFLCTLIKDEDEKVISKSIRAEVEEKLKLFSEKIKKSPFKPTLDSFLENTPEFPRRALLSRWTKGHVFENALKESEVSSTNAGNRYNYYNFENIQGAANPDYAMGVMAAVIAQVNLEMLRISRNKTSNQRFVFFCDETKFFIERNSEFFLLTTANFRKFGHAVILMAQNVRDFDIQRSEGDLDHGIILNSPSRIFFETHLPEDYLRSEFQLGNEEIDTILKNPYRGNDYRKAVLQDDIGTRVIRLYLTPQELWRVTSKREHTLKYEKLRQAVPELTADEAIYALARTQGAS
jgi:type IV secretory pathway VirB4 component